MNNLEDQPPALNLVQELEIYHLTRPHVNPAQIQLLITHLLLNPQYSPERVDYSEKSFHDLETLYQLLGFSAQFDKKLSFKRLKSHLMRKLLFPETIGFNDNSHYDLSADNNDSSRKSMSQFIDGQLEQKRVLHIRMVSKGHASNNPMCYILNETDHHRCLRKADDEIIGFLTDQDQELYLDQLDSLAIDVFNQPPSDVKKMRMEEAEVEVGLGGGFRMELESITPSKGNEIYFTFKAECVLNDAGPRCLERSSRYQKSLPFHTMIIPMSLINRRLVIDGYSHLSKEEIAKLIDRAIAAGDISEHTLRLKSRSFMHEGYSPSILVAF